MTNAAPNTSASAAPLPIDPDRLQPLLIRASAGSGKTFQLTNRYLQLAAAGAEPSSMLASTFTRLAAGQIRDRILLRLAKAIDGKEAHDELAQHLGVRDLPRESALALLARLARNLDQVQIRTLDSYFASVVHAFAIELGIPPGAEVVDEQQARQMRAEAIRLMLDERRPQDLVDLLRQLTQGESNRGVMETIDRAVSGLHSLYREAAPEAWECIAAMPGTLAPPQLVNAIQHLEGSPPAADQRFIKAHADDCRRAREWDWDAFISKGLAKTIANGSNEYYKKPIQENIVAAYQPLIAHARAELINRVREQTLATRKLLSLYHAQYEAVKHRRRAVTFDDLAAAMAKAQQLGKLDEIGFRIDAKLHHLMLDEFQDTSVPQWRALEPIVRELLSYAAPDRTFFCVGDVKQSIYRWRDASPEVMDELPRLLRNPDGSSALREAELARSYRSSQTVIDAVNRVFESLPNNDALREHPEAVELWLNGFKPHQTEKTELPGYVELRTCRAATDREKKDSLRLAAAADLAEQLHRANPNLKIAMLTRTNKAVQHLMFELGPTRRNLIVSGRGGGPLTDAPAVNAILDLLQLADHPDDTIAAFNVAGSPLGQAISLTDFANDSYRRAVSHSVRRRLLDDGYSKSIAHWVKLIAPHCDARELRRLLQLVELAAAHDDRSTLRTHDFIDMVEHTDVADVVPAPIQIMTVHQAKGLEFDAVILPDLESQLTGVKHPLVVSRRENEIGHVTEICRYMKKGTLELVPALQPLFAQHARRTVRESLSVLYVAMTRAIHALYMLIDPPAENERTTPQKLSAVLRGALADGDVTPDAVVYSHSDPHWHAAAERSPRKTPRPTAPVGEIALKPATGADALPRGLAAAAASRTASFEAAGSPAEALRLPDYDARDRGTALHLLFEQIEWLEDFTIDEQRLRQLIRSRFPRRDDRWINERIKVFNQALEKPAVRQLLSRGTADGAARRVLREHPFSRIVKGAVQSGQIDRLVIHHDPDGSIASATVIDFKTDEISADQAAVHADHYRPQMETYRAAAAELLAIKPAAIAVTLAFVATGAVVNL